MDGNSWDSAYIIEDSNIITEDYNSIYLWNISKFFILSDCTLDKILIVNCSNIRFSSNYFLTDGIAVTIVYSNDIIMDNNLIISNNGVQIIESSNITIDNNEIVGNFNSINEIRMRDSSNNTIQNNFLRRGITRIYQNESIDNIIIGNVLMVNITISQSINVITSSFLIFLFLNYFFYKKEKRKKEK